MPNPYFIIFELLVYALFGLCLVHAWRKGFAVVWQLLAGVLFGLILERATIQQLQAYEYGRFLLMLGGEVPVAVGVAWGTIIYSVRQFSAATSLPEWARPFLDALLALNLDLSMDTIAIRLGFWTWGMPIDEQFFGVPYANFWAWFWVVFSFSAGLQILMKWENPLARWVAPAGAIIMGTVGVLVTNQLIVSLSSNFSVYLETILLVLGGALVVVLAQRPRLLVHPPALSTWVPTGFHIYYLAAGFVSGIFFRLPVLLLVSLIMALAALFVHAQKPVPGNLPQGE